MKLPLNARVFRVRSIDKVPVPPRAAVVSPTRNRRIIGQDCIQRHVGFVVVMEVFRPVVDLLLAGGVPGHFTAKRIGLALPSISACAHHSFELRSLIRPAFTFQIVEKAKKDRALHLAVARVVRCLRTHRERGLIRLVEIPLPWMLRYDTLRIPREMIQRPVSRDDVRVVIGAPYIIRLFLVPTRPCFPVQGWVVGETRNELGLVEEQAFVNAILMFAAAVLEMTPQRHVDEALQLCNLLRVRFQVLLHRGGEPRTGTSLIAQACHPDASILRDLFAALIVVSDDRRRAMKRIVGLFKPLLTKEESPHIRNSLSLRLYGAVANALHRAVAVCDHDAEASP